MSAAPAEAPKPKKYQSYNEDTFKTDEQKKEEVFIVNHSSSLFSSLLLVFVLFLFCFCFVFVFVLFLFCCFLTKWSPLLKCLLSYELKMIPSLGVSSLLFTKNGSLFSIIFSVID